VTRLADQLFVVEAEAIARQARRQVARLVRLDPPVAAPQAVLVVRDSAAGSGVMIDSLDHPFDEDECPEAGESLPGMTIVSDTSGALSIGGLERDALRGAASVTVSGSVAPAPNVSGDACDVSELANWGEPRRTNGGPCTSHYAIAYAPGDLLISGGRGQGLLMVDGDLAIQGAFEFTGIVLVRGAVRVQSGSAHITGVMAVAGMTSAPSDMRAITIRYSRCAVGKALLAAAEPARVIGHSWYEVR
jgi:hypothetical protein